MFGALGSLIFRFMVIKTLTAPVGPTLSRHTVPIYWERSFWQARPSQVMVCPPCCVGRVFISDATRFYVFRRALHATEYLGAMYFIKAKDD